MYEKKIKKNITKKAPKCISTIFKRKKGQKILNGGNAMLYWRAAFEELTEKQKNKYNKKYEDELNKYFKKMKYFQKGIFDLPKRPINGFKS